MKIPVLVSRVFSNFFRKNKFENLKKVRELNFIQKSHSFLPKIFCKKKKLYFCILDEKFPTNLSRSIEENSKILKRSLKIFSIIFSSLAARKIFIRSSSKIYKGTPNFKSTCFLQINE